MLRLAGKKYAKNNAEMVESLFAADGTCAGYYRKLKGGIVFLDNRKQPFAFAVQRGPEAWFVTAGKDQVSGRTRYMSGLGEYTAKQLGINTLNNSEQHRAALELKEETAL